MADESTIDTQWQLGQRVQLVGKRVCGSIAFVGQTQFAPGQWVGVVLDEQKGRNNGSVRGITYFKCAPNCGIFVRATQLIKPTPQIQADDEVKEVVEEEEITIDMPITTNIRTTTTKIARPQIYSCSSQMALNNINMATTLQRSKTSMTCNFMTHKQASFVETGFLEILEAKFTAGQRATTTTAKQKQQQQQQQLTDKDNLLEEDFEKLKLQNKRLQQESEHLKLQQQQLLEFKAQILEQQQLLQRDLQRLQQELRDAHAEQRMLQQQTADLQDQLELVCLDKEVAEERVEALQLELEIAQEKQEELALELDILRLEKQDNCLLVSPNKMEQQQIQLRNQRLTETVLRLRDAYTQEKLLTQQQQQQLSLLQSECKQTQQAKQALKERNSYLEQQLLELKEQVDAGLGAEQMVLHLTSVKFDLEDRLKLLEEEVSELESLEQIHEQLLESSQELEQELRQEVQQLQTQIRQLEQQHNAQLQRLYERDLTISKFRKLVANLQQKQQQELENYNSLSSLNSPTSLTPYNQLFALFKTQERELELKLLQISHNSLQLHIKWLMAYVPDDLMLRAGTHDVILCLLSLQRMQQKLQLLSQAINEKFPATVDFELQPVAEGYTVARCLFRCQALYLLRCLLLALQQLSAILEGSDYELCAHMAIYRQEVEAQEGQVDGWLQLLKTDMLDEHTPTVGVELALTFCNNLLLNLLQAALPDAQALACMLQLNCLSQTLLQLYSVSCEGFVATATLLLSMLQVEAQQSEIYVFLEHFKQTVEGLMGRELRVLQRKLPASETPLQASLTRQDFMRLQRCNLQLEQALKLLVCAAKEARRVAFERQPALGECSLLPEQMQQILQQQQQQLLLDAGAMTVTDLLTAALQALQLEIEKLTEILPSAAAAPAQTGAVANTLVLHAQECALLQRATLLKACLEDVQRLQQRIEERDKEIRTLKYVAKMKQNDNSELQIRKDMAERGLSKLQQQQQALMEQLQASLLVLAERQQAQALSFDCALNRLEARLQQLQGSWSGWQQCLNKREHLQFRNESEAWQELQNLHVCLRRERVLYASQQSVELKRAFKQLTPISVPLQKRGESVATVDLQYRLHKLKKEWLLLHLSLQSGELLQEQRCEIRRKCAALLVDVLAYYHQVHPHRKVHTDFGEFSALPSIFLSYKEQN